MESSPSVREPAGKNRRPNRKQLSTKQRGSLCPASSTLNCSMEPRAGKETAVASIENADFDTPPLGTVLFVSNDDYFRATTRAFLQHVGLTVRSCDDAARVPELFFSKPAIDLLLVNVHAIGTTGLLLTAELTAFANDLPVIIISAPDREGNTLEAISSQGWTLLSKPVLLPDLLEAIHTALGRKNCPETWNTQNPSAANDDVAAGQSRFTAVSTEERRTARRPSRMLVMQGMR